MPVSVVSSAELVGSRQMGITDYYAKIPVLNLAATQGCGGTSNFLDLGGHSLHGIWLIARVAERFGAPSACHRSVPISHPPAPGPGH